MNFTETKLKGVFIIDVEKRDDERGFFGRAWCHKEFIAHGLNGDVAQTNISYNKYRGTLRGMHYQVRPFSECKVVLCTAGSIYDVVIDLRPNSETYAHWLGVELTAVGVRMLYVPEGFAHGFITLEDDTSVHYMVTEYYNQEAERGIRFDDQQINIKWPITPLFISDKDKAHVPFKVYSLATEVAFVL